MRASVVLNEVVKIYDGRPVLDGVSVEVASGEFFSLLGPSGAGKTTFLRLCAGFEHPDAGEILIDGRSMRGVPPNERPVNTVFQAYALFPHLSVEDNVGFGLTMRRVAEPERIGRVREALALLKLERLHRRLPSQLSGGEQQRVAIARALVNRPAVVLLDEPMAALDEPLRHAMLVELKTIQRQLGTTFLCITHHQEEALAVSDRLAVMQAGRIVQVGTPQEIYETPASRFVAEFLGRANVIDGTLVEGPDGARGLLMDRGEIVLPLPSRESSQHALGTRLSLVVRGEAVRLVPESAASYGQARIRVTLENRRYGGGIWHCTLRLPDESRWQAIMSIDSDGVDVPAPGSAVYATWTVARSTVVRESFP